ncbi:MAG TPA: hypothetical protein VIO38_16255 [Rariglobus sp.]
MQSSDGFRMGSLLLLIPGDDTQAVDRKVLPESQGFVSADAPLIYDYVWFDDSLEGRPARSSFSTCHD